MTLRAHWLALAAVLVACAGDPPKAPAGAAKGKISLSEPAGGRSVVATVNGHPIYESCVVSQAQALGVTPRVALEQCIEFELLARLAYERHGASAEVHEVQHRESVRAFLTKQYEPTADEPSDIPEDWIRKNLWSRPEVKVSYVRPEYRIAAYALAKYRPKGPKKILTAAHDAEMRKLAEQWHAALGGKTSMNLDEFRELVTRVAGDRKFDFIEKYNTPLEGRSVPEFAEALFALEEPGDLSGIVKSKFGYFIIMLRHIMPARNTSFEEALPDLREKIYAQWAPIAFSEYAMKLERGASVERFEENLPKVRLNIPSAFRIKP